MPVLLLFLMLTELLTVAFIVFDIHLIREWYNWKGTLDHEYARRCLYGAIALTTYSFFGKFLISRILSKFRKNEDSPNKSIVSLTNNLKDLMAL